MVIGFRESREEQAVLQEVPSEIQEASRGKD